jgi:hypothetical protein
MKGIRKMNTAALSLSDGRYYLNGLPFDGVALEALGDRRVVARHVLDGHPDAPYRPPFFSSTESDLAIDITDLVYDDVYGGRDFRVNFEGAPYSGIAYDFCDPNGECTEEYLYKKGELCGRAISNEKRYLLLTLDSDAALENYQWSNEGRLVSASLVQLGREFSLRFSPADRTDYLHISGYDLVTALSLLERSALAKIAPSASPFSLAFDTSVTFSGDGITDQVLRHFVESGLVNEVTHLEIVDHSLTSASIAPLARMPVLASLSIELNDLFRNESRACLAAVRPDLTFV